MNIRQIISGLWHWRWVAWLKAEYNCFICNKIEFEEQGGKIGQLQAELKQKEELIKAEQDAYHKTCARELEYAAKAEQLQAELLRVGDENKTLKQELNQQKILWVLTRNGQNEADDAGHRVRFHDLHDPVACIDKALQHKESEDEN